MEFRAGAWRLQVRAGKDPLTGKPRRVNATVKAPNNKTGKAAASKELARIVTEVEAGKLLPRSGLSVTELLVKSVEMRRTSWDKKSPGQATATLNRIRNDITPYIGDVRPAESLRPLDVTNLYETLRRRCRQALRSGHRCDEDCEPLAESTVRRVHDVLHAGLDWAVRNEVIPRNVADLVDPPGKPKVRKRPPKRSQVARLLAAAELELECYLRVAALNGPRRGQNTALRWRHLDLDPQPDEDYDEDDLPPGLVHWETALAIVPPVRDSEGRIVKAGGVVEKGTKTGEEWPSALDAITVGLLKVLRTQRRERALAAGVVLSEDAYVYSHDVAGRVPWRPDYATKRVGRLARRLGLDGFKLKDLRDYMATEMLGSGMDPKVMAERGGWSTVSTPTDHYAAFRPARDKAAAERLAADLDRARDSG